MKMDELNIDRIDRLITILIGIICVATFICICVLAYCFAKRLDSSERSTSNRRKAH